MQVQHDVVCPRIIGRDSQIAAVRGVLDTVRGGLGQVALIVGEAGVGKSRLLREMTEAARDAGFFVLRGASFESERSIPYAPLLDLVRLFSASSTPALVAHVLAPAANDLVSMFPELRSMLPDAIPSSVGDPESDKRRLFAALAQTITTLARKQPVFLSFEDVHWTDDATLDLIFHLARSHSSLPLGIALTYRHEETGPRLKRLIGDLERAGIAATFQLRPLDRSDVEERLITFEYPFSPAETVELFRSWYGPTVRAFAGLDESGRAALEDDLVHLWSDHNLAVDGTTRVHSEYLEVIGVVR